MIYEIPQDAASIPSARRNAFVRCMCLQPGPGSMTALLRTLLLRSKAQAAHPSSPPPIPQPPSSPPSPSRRRPPPSRRRPPDARHGAHTCAPSRSQTEGTRPSSADSVGARDGSFAHRFRASVGQRPLLSADHGAVATRAAPEAALAGPAPSAAVPSPAAAAAPAPAPTPLAPTAAQPLMTAQPLLTSACSSEGEGGFELWTVPRMQADPRPRADAGALAATAANIRESTEWRATLVAHWARATPESEGTHSYGASSSADASAGALSRYIPYMHNMDMDIPSWYSADSCAPTSGGGARGAAREGRHERLRRRHEWRRRRRRRRRRRLSPARRPSGPSR